ncbi:MAG TPA: Asp-tRNA(Asn)/Glu-tRNA(Gln) amidotransferase GatCAB subunit C [Opitutae bacterium]|nr:Asp-tRNA(Asn)/Glu-tRNA(Gln) amidotransferase GatCAB subunit C [Opitutae bacterium]
MSTQIDIDYISKLARIELSEDEKATFTKQLKQVFEYCQKLNEVDVSGIEPTSHAYPVFNVWQEDTPTPCFTQSQALSNAPERRDSQVVVPLIIE